MFEIAERKMIETVLLESGDDIVIVAGAGEAVSLQTQCVFVQYVVSWYAKTDDPFYQFLFCSRVFN